MAASPIRRAAEAPGREVFVVRYPVAGGRMAGRMFGCLRDAVEYARTHDGHIVRRVVERR